MVDKDVAVEFCEKVADRIEQGWCQHKVSDGFGNVCAIGAMQDVRETDYVRYSFVISPVRTRFADIVQDHMVVYNNAEGRTAAEVADVFRVIGKDFANGE
jgi:hypothetical protein